jgi:hypothetical protein
LGPNTRDVDADTGLEAPEGDDFVSDEDGVGGRGGAGYGDSEENGRGQGRKVKCLGDEAMAKERLPCTMAAMNVVNIKPKEI